MTEATAGPASGGKRVVANAVYLMATNVWRIVVNMGVFFIIARVMGAEELGRYAFALSYATLFSIACDLGLNDLIIRQVAIDKAAAPRYLTAAFIIRVLMGVVVTGATAVTIGVSGKPTAVQELVLAAALNTSLVTGVETIVVAFFYAYERMSYVLALGLIRSTLNAGVGIGAAYAGLGARGVMWGFLFVEALCAVLSFIWVRWRLGIGFAAVRFRDFPPLLWRSLPFGLNGVFITIYMQLHYSLLSFYEGDKVTGTFAAAAKLVTFLTFVPSAFTQAMYPYLSRLAAGDGPTPREPAVRSIRYLALISLPAALVLFFRADAIVALAYGAKYADAARLLRVLAWTLPFIFATYPLAVALNAIHRERANTAVAAGGAAVNVAANLLLIPLFGPLGAAVAYLITETTQTVARQVLVRIWMGPLALVKTLWPVAVPAAAMAAVMFFTRRLGLFVELPLLAVIYVGCAFATGAISRDDIAALLKRRAA